MQWQRLMIAANLRKTGSDESKFAASSVVYRRIIANMHKIVQCVYTYIYMFCRNIFICAKIQQLKTTITTHFGKIHTHLQKLC